MVAKFQQRNEDAADPEGRVSTGLPGLDEVCQGGLPAQAAYLIQGGPGSGKTTLALHFLEAGSRQGQTGLFISFSETEARLRRNAPQALQLSNVVFLDLSPTASAFTDEESYDVFSASEVEGEPLMQQIRETVDRHQPQRVVIDSMTHLNYLAPDPYQHRKRVMALIRYLVTSGATAVFTSEATTHAPDDDLAFLSDGIIRLTDTGELRRLDVTKLRGSGTVNGPHTVTRDAQRMVVHPRMWPTRRHYPDEPEQIGTGIANLDCLLGGGVGRGTTTVISGPSGVGKTSLGIQFMKEAAGRGERSVILSFEEASETLLNRSRAINVPIDGMIDNGILALYDIEPRTYSIEEIFTLVREEVEQRAASVVMVDSIVGLRQAIKGDDDVLARLHDLCRYLGNMGLTVFVVDEIEELSGGNTATRYGFSYLCDNAVLVRFRNDGGHLARAVAMLKKRSGPFETTPRTYSISAYGLDVGEPIDSLSGILGNT